VFSVDTLFLFGFCGFVFGLGSDSNVRAIASSIAEELHHVAGREKPGKNRMNKEPQTGKKAKTIHVDIVSAEGTAFAGPARLVVAPAVMGAVGVLPGHSPLLTRLHPGEIRIEQSEGEEAFLLYTSGGLMEVQPSQVTILSDTALRADAIDEAAALAAKRHAEEVMVRTGSDNFDYASAKRELAQALAQLKTLEDAKKRSYLEDGDYKVDYLKFDWSLNIWDRPEPDSGMLPVSN